MLIGILSRGLQLLSVFVRSSPVTWEAGRDPRQEHELKGPKQRSEVEAIAIEPSSCDSESATAAWNPEDTSKLFRKPHAQSLGHSTTSTLNLSVPKS